MKKIAFLFSLLLSVSVSAQTLNITLPDTLAGKNWVRNLIKEELKNSGVKPNDPVVVKPDPCKAGPEILEITNSSATYLNARFHGEKVEVIDWHIKDSKGDLVRNGEVAPKNNTPGITFGTLPSGTYTLTFTGKSCVSAPSSKAFTIGGSVGVVTPPSGEKNVSGMAKGMDGHMQLVWTKQGDFYLVSDIAKAPIGDAYEFRYLIGSEIVKTGKNPLSNYRIAGNNPGRIIKYKIKPSLVLNNWTDRASDEVGGYFSMGAAEGFTHNTSIPFHTYSFPGTTGDFINPIPSAFNPSLQNTQWGDFAPDMQLPAGHVFISDPRPWGYEKMFKKGITHISNYALPWSEGAPYSEVIRLRDAGLSYNDVPRIETVFGIQKQGNTGQYWPNGTSKDWWPQGAPTYEEGVKLGQKADNSHAIFIGEFTENESWLPPSEPTFKGFYSALRPRYEERFAKRGIPYYICHDYLFLGGERLNAGRDHAKRILQLTPEQMPTSNYSPGGSLSETNLIVETVYLDAPDKHAAQPYELIFRLEYFKQMGYHAGVFLAGVHEWRPNNRYQVDYPEGKFFLQNKLPLDPSLHIANGFLAQVYGNLFVEWGGNGKVENKTIPEDWAHGLWYPNGSNDSQGGFPYYKKNGDKDSYYGYSASVDLSYFSQKLFNDTYGKVDGGSDRYLKFRIDGGNWVSPSDDDFIDAYYEKRGFVHSRTLHGNTAFFFLNCFTDNSAHVLEVEMPNGFIWKGSVAGNGIHAKLL